MYAYHHDVAYCLGLCVSILYMFFAFLQSRVQHMYRAIVRTRAILQMQLKEEQRSILLLDSELDDQGKKLKIIARATAAYEGDYIRVQVCYAKLFRCCCNILAKHCCSFLCRVLYFLIEIYGRMFT